MSADSAVRSPLDPSRLTHALQRATAALLAEQGSQGVWTGELSSSALATATAVTALAVVQRAQPSDKFETPIAAGLEWLAQHTNTDGGWGDTNLSLSNLSTTALGWAAFGAVPGADARYREVVDRAASWLTRAAGSITPDQLAPAIIRRYGKDRTFSVPILTLCALAGRLGAGAAAWKWVIPLPFELAACPPRLFAALRLPVVSYALPALIAIGQARHVHRPSANPIARLLRTLARQRTLDVLETLQPQNGGFLEATPLTSFVVMSLAGSGQVGHPVTRRGAEFLLTARRADGSWPIDTNLATWLTTLAVNALAGDEATMGWPASETAAVRHWLLQQQYRQEHPYTHAAPGGWAWTDLPGGVPDADDTAGALLALRRLDPDGVATREAAEAGIGWLLGLQNRDGGIPTFCRGWGNLPFDRSSADITAHALQAWMSWTGAMSDALRERMMTAMGRALDFLSRGQRADGSWVPLWFGNQFAPEEQNLCYGTSRVMRALAATIDFASRSPGTARLRSRLGSVRSALARGARWLLAQQGAEGGWGGTTAHQASVEETAWALEGLVCAGKRCAPGPEQDAIAAAVERGADWLIARVESETWTQPAPVGFYFAKLWYYERLYPLIFTVGALREVRRFGHGDHR